MDGSLYLLHHYQGVLSRIDAATGVEPQPPMRLSGIGNVYASLLGASDRVYITDLQGATLVLGHANQPQILALNHLEDQFSALTHCR